MADKKRSADWTCLTRENQNLVIDQVLKGIKWNRLTRMINSVTVNCGCNGKPPVMPIKPTMMKTRAIGLVRSLLRDKNVYSRRHSCGLVADKVYERGYGHSVRLAFIPEEVFAVAENDFRADVV